MSQKSSVDTVLECYRRAAEAHRIAATDADPVTKAAFVEIERHWRFLARKFQSETRTDQTQSPRNTYNIISEPRELPARSDAA